MDKRTLAEKSVASKRQREKDDEIQVSENQKRKMEKARWWLNDNIVDSELSIWVWKNKKPYLLKKQMSYFEGRFDETNGRETIYYKLARKFEKDIKKCREQFKEEARVWCLCAKRLKIHKDIVSIVVKLLLTQEPFPRE